MNRLVVPVVVAATLLSPRPAVAGPDATDSLSSDSYAADFEGAWTFVRDRYAYFDRKKTDWERVRANFLPRVKDVRGHDRFIRLLEEMLEQLYDPHAHLGVNTPSSPRLVPSGTDLWSEFRDGRAFLVDVRAGSEAERVGLRPGMEVLSIQGQPVEEAVRHRLPVTLSEPDSAALDWALRAALAGHHDESMKVEIRSAGRKAAFAFRPGRTNPPETALTVRILDGNVGYIRLHDSLGDPDLVAAWDSALLVVRETRSLVLDLRDTPSGGNSTIARSLLSRLVPDIRPYQRHDLPAELRHDGVERIWVEYVAPRGPFTYDKPMVVLVNHWTGSMGEGVTIGLDGMQRATVIGTAMAGLRGATYSETLPHTGFQVRVPVERLFHVDGTPREAFLPRVLVEPTPSRDDRTLEVALEWVRRRSDPER